MNIIHEEEEQSECSLSSGISFPSLKKIHFQEEGDVDRNACSGEVDGIVTHNADGRDEESVKDTNYTIQNTSHVHDDEYDDGYPTDEHTIPSFTQTEKELKRQNILQLARSRLAKKKSNNANGCSDEDVDNSSFLADIDVADVDNKPDDSSFLDNAFMDDAPNEFEFVGDIGETDSHFDIHASTLSRASASTKASTIGDEVLKESNMARNGKKDDDQSASTYSYRRAFESGTLGSYYASTCSALTDEYCYDARKTGMSDAIITKETRGLRNLPYGDIKRAACGPVDADTGAMIHPSDESEGDSQARPPPPSISNQSAYENSEHLSRIVSYGDGEGYVDEQTERKFDPSGKAGRCGWLTSSSRMVKLVVMFSILLMLISVASVALALALPKEDNGGGESFNRSSSAANDAVGSTQGGIDDLSKDIHGGKDAETPLLPTGSLAPTPSPSRARSVAVPLSQASAAVCNDGAKCTMEGSRCTDGTTEACCGETFDSFVCDCANVNGNMKYVCVLTDACLAPSCETSETPVPTNSSTAEFPFYLEMPIPSKTPKTTAPSKAPESTVYYTSSANIPTMDPSTASTLAPSKRLTQLPSQEPSNQPTSIPTITPSQQPTTQRPTPIPTEFPIISKIPTSAPMKTPTTGQPTTRSPTPISTKAPIIPSIIPTAAPISPSSPPTAAQGSTQTVKLQVTKDTYVTESSSQAYYGDNERLRVDGKPRVWSFIAFNTTSVIKNTSRSQRESKPSHQKEPRKMHSVQLLRATLRLYSLGEGAKVIFYALPNADLWTEAGLSWDSMSKVDRSEKIRVGYIDWVSSKEWYEIDVTAAFTINEDPEASTTFLITSASTNGVAFASRERSSGDFSPELILTYATDSDVGPNLSPASSPTRGRTYFPTRRAATFSPMEPTEKPTAKPITNSPTSRPPTFVPSMQPTKVATGTVLVQKSIAPPGCTATSDIIALAEAFESGQTTQSVQIVFPRQDSYVGGGIFSDENHGSADALILDSPTSKALIQFDIGLIASTNRIHNVVSASLRLFVNEVGGTGSLSQLDIYRLPNSFEWDEGQITLNNFEIPPVAESGPVTFQAKSSDLGRWIDIDIKDFIEGAQADDFLLSMIISASGENGKYTFASRETCYSSKLVVVTESIPGDP